jgi:hypothetical protein
MKIRGKSGLRKSKMPANGWVCFYNESTTASATENIPPAFAELWVKLEIFEGFLAIKILAYKYR